MSPAWRVRLRDVTLDDADMVDGWERDLGGYNDFGLPGKRIDREALERGPLRDEHHGMLLVELVADGRPIGTLSWHRVRYGPNESSAAFNFGIDLRPEARGQGYGTEAQALLADYLFATTEVFRLEASTDVTNIAEQRALERAGFSREGVTRGAQVRGGGRHDLVTYSRLRDDPSPDLPARDTG